MTSLIRFDPNNITVQDINQHFGMLYADFFQKFFKRVRTVQKTPNDVWLGHLNAQFNRYGFYFSGMTSELLNNNREALTLNMRDSDDGVMLWDGRIFAPGDLDFQVREVTMKAGQTSLPKTATKQTMLVQFHKTFSTCLRGVSNPAVFSNELWAELDSL